MVKPIISVRDITKVYETKTGGLFKKKTNRKVRALHNLSFDVQDGEMIGLLGPNGAGKTTLIKILTLLLLPSGGTFVINNIPGDLKFESKIKASIGAMLMGERGLYWKLTGRENLEYFCSLYHIPRSTVKDRTKYLIDLLDLSSIADRHVETYSSGQKMKFAFLRSLVSDPPILILDEPTIAMDVQGARDLRQIIKKLHEENSKTILYSTHIMTEVEELANRAVIIDSGELVAYDTVENLKQSLEQDESITVEGIFPDKSFLPKLEALPEIKHVAYTQSSEIGGNDKITAIVTDSRKSMSNILKVLQQTDSRISYIYPKEITLEDVFIARTGHSLSAESEQVTTL
ncbi:MAG: Carnitine transport ATP-binding protein OpuCA [Candidatus Heimdallarchaeota archaeon LC_3]|nr:MAG: Carnitine transport ATP-binding protein OpuCA [Candidatus Heimdallarchaeota archaeon LC_3]